MVELRKGGGSRLQKPRASRVGPGEGVNEAGVELVEDQGPLLGNGVRLLRAPKNKKTYRTYPETTPTRATNPASDSLSIGFNQLVYHNYSSLICD
jgi:hypothetical protein